MTRYEMSDGMVVDTRNASECWDEGTRWDGSNHISVATGTQWDHQALYRSRRGRYYIECTSQRQGCLPRAEWLSNEDAARWLLANRPEVEPLPEDLQDVADDLME